MNDQCKIDYWVVLKAACLICGFLFIIIDGWFLAHLSSLQKQYMFYGSPAAALLIIPLISNQLFKNKIILVLSLLLIIAAIINLVDTLIQKGINYIVLLGIVLLGTQFYRVLMCWNMKLP
jgi:hypothetical protein